MDDEQLLESITSTASNFIATVFYRSHADMETSVLDHDGSVIVGSNSKSIGHNDMWRALYVAMTNDGSNVLMVTPTQNAAHGQMLLFGDEFDRSMFPEEALGIERITQQSIQFNNGSVINVKHAESGSDAIRGYAPDLLVVDNWEEEGVQISDGTKENVLLPMLELDCDVWINCTEIDTNDVLVRNVIEDGALVKQLD